MQIPDFEKIFLLKSCFTEFWFCVYLLEPIPECTPDLCQNGGKMLTETWSIQWLLLSMRAWIPRQPLSRFIYFYQYLAKPTKYGIEEAP